MRAMRCTLLALALLACSNPPEPPPREPIDILYVGAPQLPIHGKPSESSRVLSTYRQGEAVTILATKGEWVEVRLGSGDTGWAKKTLLTAVQNAGEFSSATSARFRVQPNPVYSHQKLTGEIILEASVNSDGDILSVRTLRNTTGSKALEAENRAALMRARFYPMLIRGRRQPFVYEYRVEY